MTVTDFYPARVSQRTTPGSPQNSALGTSQQDNPISITDIYLTATEAAKVLRLHPVTLLRWAREGRIPHRRLSPRKIVFPLSKLTAWMDKGSNYTDNAVHAAQPERTAA